MISFIIEHIKLRQRINAGYLFTGIASLMIVIITYLTFSDTAKSFSQFVKLSIQSRGEVQLTSNVREIQRQAMIYIYEGHKGAAQRVDDISILMLQQLAESRSLEDPRITSMHKQIAKHLNTYSDTFQMVRERRFRQQQLVNTEFRDHANQVESLLTALLQRPSQSEANLLKLQQVLNALLLVEKNAFRYFDSLDARHVAEAKSSIHKAVSGLEQLAEQSDGEDLRISMQTIGPALDRYENSFLKAVQLTRGYLYLINVVMAAEAYEVLYQVEKLSQHLDKQMIELEASILTRVASALRGIMIIGAVLLVLIIVFSYVIGQSIASPLQRLTGTFKTLATGSSKATIPQYLLTDELGSLTSAAEAFRKKNEQTETLLKRSMDLTEELENNKAELERSNEELEQFVYTVSHDLKSPLVTSMGFIGIIQKLTAQGKHKQAVEKLDKVVESNKRMGQLINDLLELSRVGRIDMDMKLIDLVDLLGDLSKRQEEHLARLGFQFKINSDLPVVLGNESRVLQLFENILSNAVKYVTNIEEPPLLEVGSIPDEQGLLIYCKDNGPGIAKSYHEKIFGLFYRLDSQQEGTGIGLAVAKKVMKFHSGEIWVESEEGKGAVFWLRFPHPPSDLM